VFRLRVEAWEQSLKEGNAVLSGEVFFETFLGFFRGANITSATKEDEVNGR